jgi:hypothetical protein
MKLGIFNIVQSDIKKDWEALKDGYSRTKKMYQFHPYGSITGTFGKNLITILSFQEVYTYVRFQIL